MISGVAGVVSIILDYSTLQPAQFFVPKLENNHTISLTINYYNAMQQNPGNSGTNKTSAKTCDQLWYEGVIFLLYEGLQTRLLLL